MTTPNGKIDIEKPFAFKNINDFDNHIDLSIPNYSFVANEVKQLSEYFIQDDTIVYDLGCSTGKFLKSLTPHEGVMYVGIDEATNLLPVERSTKLDNHAKLIFNDADLLDYDYGVGVSSFVVSMFTLQFLPLHKRKILIQKIYDSLIPGGAFVSCEKIYSSTSKFQDITNSIYYEYKEKSFSAKEILDKERDLRKIMKIQKLEDSIEDMSYIGPTEVFWRSHNFVGICSIKE
jgi:tRNA (cmo5U34)-methyltransferase